MLGINTKRTLISGKLASEIRNRINRIQSGRLNQEDWTEILKNRRVSNRYSVRLS